MQSSGIDDFFKQRMLLSLITNQIMHVQEILNFQNSINSEFWMIYLDKDIFKRFPLALHSSDLKISQ